MFLLHPPMSLLRHATGHNLCQILQKPTWLTTQHLHYRAPRAILEVKCFCYKMSFPFHSIFLYMILISCFARNLTRVSECRMNLVHRGLVYRRSIYLHAPRCYTLTLQIMYSLGFQKNIQLVIALRNFLKGRETQSALGGF